MNAVTLNYWLGKFVMEVTKTSGKGYPPKTVYRIICGIPRYLEENGAEALNPLDNIATEGEVNSYHLFNKNVQL